MQPLVIETPPAGLLYSQYPGWGSDASSPLFMRWTAQDASAAYASWLQGADGSGTNLAALYASNSSSSLPTPNYAFDAAFLSRYNYYLPVSSAIGSSIVANAVSASTNTTLPGTLLAARLRSTAEVVLSLDLWAWPSTTDGASSMNPSLPSSLSASVPFGAQRGVAVNAATDAYVVRSGAGSVYAPCNTTGNSSAAASDKSTICGALVLLQRVTWTLRGWPLQSSRAWDVASITTSIAPLHVVTLTSTTGTLLVKTGTLAPGYAYSVEASVTSAVVSLVTPSTLVSTAARLKQVSQMRVSAGADSSGATTRRLQGGSSTQTPSPTPAVNVASGSGSNATSASAAGSNATATGSSSTGSGAASTDGTTVTGSGSTGVNGNTSSMTTTTTSGGAQDTSTGQVLPSSSTKPTTPTSSSTPSSSPLPPPIDIAPISSPSTPLFAPIVYVRTPPRPGSVTSTPASGTAILTSFTIATRAWSSDALLQPSNATAMQPLVQDVLAFAAATFLSPSLIRAQLAQATVAAASTSTATAVVNWTAISSNAATQSSACTSDNIPQSLAAASTVLGVSTTTSCRSITTAATDGPTSVLQLASVAAAGQSSGDAQGATTMALQPIDASNKYSFSFRADPTGALPVQPDEATDPGGWASYSSSLTVTTSWTGLALGPSQSAPSIYGSVNISGPMGEGLGPNATSTLVVLVVDDEGNTGIAYGSVTVRPAMSASEATNPSAVSNFVSNVASSLLGLSSAKDSGTDGTSGGNGSSTAPVITIEKAYVTLAVVSQLGGLLAGASTSGFGSSGSDTTGSSSSTSNLTSSEIAGVRRNNTAVRALLMDALFSAVTVMGSSGLGAGSTGGSTPDNSGNVTTPAVAVGTIALDDSSIATAACALTALTSDPNELSDKARTRAVDTVSTMLTLSIPSGLTDEVSSSPSGASSDGEDTGSGGSGSGSTDGGSTGSSDTGSGSGAGSSTTTTSSSSSSSSTAPIPVFPTSSGDAIMSVLVNVIAVDALPDAPVSSVSATGSGSNGTNATGADAAAAAAAQQQAQAAAAAAAMQTKISSTLKILSSALLRSAQPGDPPVSVGAGPSSAFVSAVRTTFNSTTNGTATDVMATPYCGPALSMTSARLKTTSATSSSSGTGASVNLGRPLSPCFNDTATNISVGSLSPPAVDVPVDSLSSGAQGAAFKNLTAVNIAVVQYGTSPVSEFNGWKGMVVPSGAASAAAANGLSSGSGTAASSRATGRSLLSADMQALEKQFEASASAAINAAGLSTSSSSSGKDLDPNRGLDTRVLSISIQNRAGKTLNVTGMPKPFVIVIPLQDPSEVSPAMALANSTAQTRKFFSFVCPAQVPGSSAAASEVSDYDTLHGWNDTSATSVAATELTFDTSRSHGDIATGTLLASTSIDLPIVAMSSISYTVGIGPRAGSSGSTSHLPFSTYNYDTTFSSFGNAASYEYVAGRTAVAYAVVNVIQVDCGGMIGRHNITCGPGYAAQPINYSCPVAQAVPVCAYWSESQQQWSSEGCDVVTVNTSAIVCACTHLTNFAARFSALEQAQKDIFAKSSLLADPNVFLWYPYVFLIIGGISTFIMVAIGVTHALDKSAAIRFYTVLVRDEEIAFMAKIYALRGIPFVLDKLIDEGAGAGAAASGKKSGPKLKGTASSADLHEALAATAAVARAKYERRSSADGGLGIASSPSSSSNSAYRSPINGALIKGPHGRRASADVASPASAGAGRRHQRFSSVDTQSSNPAAGASAQSQSLALSPNGRNVHVAVVHNPAPRVNGAVSPSDSLSPSSLSADNNNSASKSGKQKQGSRWEAVFDFALARSTPDDASQAVDEVATATTVAMRGRQPDPYAAALYVKLVSAYGKLKVALPALKGDPQPQTHQQTQAQQQPRNLQLPQSLLQSQLEADDGSGTVGAVNAASELQLQDIDPDTPSAPSSALVLSNDTPSAQAGGGAANTARDGRTKLGVNKLLAVSKRGLTTAQRGISQMMTHAVGGQFVQQRLEALKKVTAAVASFDTLSNWTPVRLWQMKGFLAQVWWLRIQFHHPYVSAFTRYDPRTSRTNRLLALLTLLLIDMFTTAFFYAFRNGNGVDDLPDLEIPEIIVLSVMTAVIAQPLSILVGALMRASGEAEFRLRYPSLWAELRRRKRAEDRLSQMSTAQLEMELDALGIQKPPPDGNLKKAVSAVSLSRQGGSGGAAGQKRRSSFASIPGVPRPTPDPNNADTAATKQSDVVGIDAAAEAVEDDDDDDDAHFEYGWIDAPEALVRHSSCLVRLLKRHPDQKAAYIQKHREAEAKAIAKEMATKARRAAGKFTLIERFLILIGRMKRHGDEDGDDRSNGRAGAGRAHAKALLSSTAIALASGSKHGRRRGGVSAVRAVTATAHAGAAGGGGVRRSNVPQHQNRLVMKSGSGKVLATGASAAAIGTAAQATNYASFGGTAGGTINSETNVDDMYADVGGDGDGALPDAAAPTTDDDAATIVRSVDDLGLVTGLDTMTTSFGTNGATDDAADPDSASSPGLDFADFDSLPPQLKKQLVATRMAAEEEEDEELARADIEYAMRTKGGRCRCVSHRFMVSRVTIVTHMLLGLVMAWCLYYMLVFGMYQPKSVLLSWMWAYGADQAVGIFIIAPKLTLVNVVWKFGIWPSWAPWIMWIPVVGPLLASKQLKAMATEDGSESLTGRLQNLTLIRAAGFASYLSPDNAVIAFGATTAMAATISNVSGLLKKAGSGNRAGKRRDSLAFQALTSSQRHQLIVQRYLHSLLQRASERSMANMHDNSSADVRSLLLLQEGMKRRGSSSAAGGGGTGLGVASSMADPLRMQQLLLKNGSASSLDSDDRLNSNGTFHRNGAGRARAGNVNITAHTGNNVRAGSIASSVSTEIDIHSPVNRQRQNPSGRGTHQQQQYQRRASAPATGVTGLPPSLSGHGERLQRLAAIESRNSSHSDGADQRERGDMSARGSRPGTARITIVDAARTIIDSRSSRRSTSEQPGTARSRGPASSRLVIDNQPAGTPEGRCRSQVPPQRLLQPLLAMGVVRRCTCRLWVHVQGAMVLQDFDGDGAGGADDGDNAGAMGYRTRGTTNADDFAARDGEAMHMCSKDDENPFGKQQQYRAHYVSRRHSTGMSSSSAATMITPAAGNIMPSVPAVRAASNTHTVGIHARSSVGARGTPFKTHSTSSLNGTAYAAAVLAAAVQRQQAHSSMLNMGRVPIDRSSLGGAGFVSRRASAPPVTSATAPTSSSHASMASVAVSSKHAGANSASSVTTTTTTARRGPSNVPPVTAANTAMIAPEATRTMDIPMGAAALLS